MLFEYYALNLCQNLDIFFNSFNITVTKNALIEKELRSFMTELDYSHSTDLALEQGDSLEETYSQADSS